METYVGILKVFDNQFINLSITIEISRGDLAPKKRERQFNTRFEQEIVTPAKKKVIKQLSLSLSLLV